MKAFIAGIVTITFLVFSVSLNAVMINRKTSEILEKLEKLPKSSYDTDVSSLITEWEGSKTWIALTVHRENVDDIDDTLAQLRLEADRHNDIGYQAELKKMICLVKRLRETESFSLKRIF